MSVSNTTIRMPNQVGECIERVVPYYWSDSLLDYVVATTGGVGPGSDVKVTNIVPVTIGDGSSVALGARNDAAWDGVAASATTVAILKRLNGLLAQIANTISAASNPAQTGVTNSAAQILAANASRKRFMVQNTGLTVIKLVLGAGTPTQTAYHVALSPCIAADDGKGAVYVDELWTGAVQAIGSAAGGTVVVTELT